jgi:hypothetical protein
VVRLVLLALPLAATLYLFIRLGNALHRKLRASRRLRAALLAVAGRGSSLHRRHGEARMFFTQLTRSARVAVASMGRRPRAAVFTAQSAGPRREGRGHVHPNPHRGRR